MNNEHINEQLKEQNIDMEPNPRVRQLPFVLASKRQVSQQYLNEH